MACPRGAIEFAFAAYDIAHAVKPGESILEKTLEIFEERGSFRRLLPMEDIGWDTPFWTFKKPRYKIA